MEDITLVNVIGIITGCIALLISFGNFLKDTKKEVRDDLSVDSSQNEKIIELRGKIELIKSELQGQINVNTKDTERIKTEIIGIVNKLDKLIELHMQGK